MQDATFGIGGTAANASEDGSTVDEDERRDKLSPLPGDEVSLETDEEEEEEEEAAPDTAIPDFRSEFFSHVKCKGTSHTIISLGIDCMT